MIWTYLFEWHRPYKKLRELRAKARGLNKLNKPPNKPIRTSPRKFTWLWCLTSNWQKDLIASLKGTLARADMRTSAHSRETLSDSVFMSAAIMELRVGVNNLYIFFIKSMLRESDFKEIDILSFTKLRMKRCTCTTNRKENISRGFPCKGRNELCSHDCKCGTSSETGRNRVCMQLKFNNFSVFFLEVGKCRTD